MDEKLKKYFKETKDHAILVDCPYMEIRLSKDLIKDNIAQIIGNKVHTFGYLDLYVWDDLEKIETDEYKIIEMRLPTPIITEPNRIEYNKKSKEYILEYYKADVFLASTLLERSAKVVSDFTDLLLKGKLPDDMGYDELSKSWAECCRINDVNLRVNYLFLDLIVMVVCRNPENMSEEYRHYLTKNPNADLHTRILTAMNRVPMMTSPLAAISSENPKFGVTTVIGSTRAGEMDPEETPIEKAIQ